MKITNPNKVNIYLRDGTEYLGKEPTAAPFATPGIFGFYDSDNCVIVIPFDLIKRIEMYQE